MQYEFRYVVRKINRPVTEAPVGGFIAGFNLLGLAKEYARFIHDKYNLTYVFCEDKPVFCIVNNSSWGKNTEEKEIEYD